MTMTVMVMMTTTTGRDSNCCWYFLVKIIFFIEGVLGRVLFFIFSGSLMISCKCTGLLLMLSPRLCLISWFVSTCVTNRCELTTWEPLLQLQSVCQGWIQQMQREEGKNLLKIIIFFAVPPVRLQWLTAMLGESLGKDSQHPLLLLR